MIKLRTEREDVAIYVNPDHISVMREHGRGTRIFMTQPTECQDVKDDIETVFMLIELDKMGESNDDVPLES